MTTYVGKDVGKGDLQFTVGVGGAMVQPLWELLSKFFKNLE